MHEEQEIYFEAFWKAKSIVNKPIVFDNIKN